jgi:hypothetical protein
MSGINDSTFECRYGPSVEGAGLSTEKLVGVRWENVQYGDLTSSAIRALRELIALSVKAEVWIGLDLRPSRRGDENLPTDTGAVPLLENDGGGVAGFHTSAYHRGFRDLAQAGFVAIDDHLKRRAQLTLKGFALLESIVGGPLGAG